MEKKTEFISYLQNIIIFLLGLTLLIFPLTFLTFTTDAFTTPKQILLGAVVSLTLVLFAIKTLLSRKVILRRTPFDVPILLFTGAILLSSVFSVNRADALTSFVPFFFSVLLYFVVVQSAKEKSLITFLSSSFITGALVVSVLAVLSFFKIYAVPFSFARTQTFTTLGSLLDQTIYLAVALVFAGAVSWPIIKRFTSPRTSAFEKEKIEAFDSGFFLATIVILAGTIVSLYTIFKIQKPLLLPFETGFQTAFAEISQDSGRVFQGFLFGSGFGTYITDFSRFKTVAYNQNPQLWSVAFIRSSSFILELLATTGILGLISFLFLIYKIVKEKGLFPPLVLLAATSFILPLNFITITLFFVVLALYTSMQGLSQTKQHKYFDVELHLEALKNGIISGNLGRFLPVLFFVLVLLIISVLGFFSTKYILSDLTFQKSLVAASQNNGSQTYQLQTEAIKTYPYRDAYFRIFSQTNFALANSLISSQPKGSSPSAQTQQTVLTLTQQSINAARQATVVSPQSAVNWNNLSSIYRSLIGFGQNAENFAISSGQQAAALDPTNPQQYINLGGIYYQLGQWDNAQNQFQIAVNLKPDLANAYYNLGHALEQKGDLKGALAQYQIVKNLVVNDKKSLEAINKEIEALQAKIGQAPATGEKQTTTSNQTPLEISTPSAQLPAQNPPVKIPSPPTSTTSAK